MSDAAPNPLLKLTIDGHELEVARGTTILDAARSVGVDIPTFCYHPGLSAPANCRMCLVNTNKAPKLLPACYATCMDGMEVTTDDEKTLATRKSTLEFILLHHPVDCPICDQAGECVLQDNYFNHSAQPSRLFTMKGTKPKATPLGPNVMLDAERCIVCTRCVRFCDEVARTGELRVVHRGERSFVTTFPGVELDNAYATCAADICPVGALTSRDFRFKMRVWFLKTADSVCSGCSRGCNIHIDHGDGRVQRYRPRENREINDWWMCDAGRLSYKEFQQDRITHAWVDGDEMPVRQALTRSARKLGRIVGQGKPEKLAIVPSLLSTNEEIEALLAFGQQVGVTRWYVGGRADGAQDDLLIRADKNPNRTGLHNALEAIDTQASPLSSLAADIDSGAVDGVLWVGHEHGRDDAVSAALARLSAHVVVASNHSEWTRKATVVLPMKTFEETTGHWTNFEGVVQRITAGPPAPGDAQSLQRLLADLGRRMGLQVVEHTQGVSA